MKKLVFFTGLFVALSCFAQYSGGGGYSGGGNASISGDVTNGNLVVSSGGRTFVDAGVAPYDPNILLAMIGTNSTLIGNITGANAVTVATTSSAAENGTNLIALVDAYSLAGTDMTIICPPADYTIPSTLVISNAVINVICMETPPLEWWKPKYYIHTSLPTEPLTPIRATITGNVTITQDALGSEVAGFKIVGNVSAPTTDGEDARTPSILRDCWTTGTISAGEDSALFLDRVFAQGAVCAGGRWDGNIYNSALLADTGLDVVLANGSGITSRNIEIRDSWIRADDIFGFAVTSTKLYINGGFINGDGAFANDGTASGQLSCFNVIFYDADVSVGWNGITGSAVTRFDYCSGISTNNGTFSSAPFLYCSDSTGATIP